MHRLGESAADQLRGHLEQCISDRHTQPCRAADLGWQLRLQWRSHALACTNYTIFVVHRCMVCVCDLPLSGARSPTPLQRHTQPCRAADLGWQLRLQWRSHALACTNYTIFVVHRCMASLWDLPLSGARCPTPLENWSRNGPFSGTFSPMNALWRRQFDIDENETNCVNYKYCLVDAPGVSDSCID